MIEYIPLILEGMLLNIKLLLLSLVVATLCGIFAAQFRLSKSRIFQNISFAYSTLIRGIPSLVFIFLFYYGIQEILNRLGDRYGWDYIDFNAFTAGILALGVTYGAYMAETFRGALMAVPKGQIEAGHAYGMTSLTVFRRITLPAMIPHALSGYSNIFLVLAKDTALVSIIGLREMTSLGNSIGNSIQMPFLVLSIVAILFLAITAVSDLFFKSIEARVNRRGQ